MSSTTHPIELARERDAAHIAAMSRRLIEAGLPPSWPLERVLGHIRRSDSLVLAHRREGRLAGFAIMQFGDTRAHLNLLAVEPRWQRAGIGRAMITWLEDSARVAGTFTITLELRAGNGAARRFYEALGYHETGRLAGYYQRREDALTMMRDLRVGSEGRRPLAAD